MGLPCSRICKHGVFMTNFLKKYVQKRGKPGDLAVRTACGRLSGWVGIACNVLLCAAKLTVGTLSGSVSITADAVNNLSDAAGSVVTLIGFQMASKPADREHPYGHDRMEYLSGLVVAALILLIGAELVKSSVQKILHPEAVEFSGVMVAVLLASIAVKLGMALFNRDLGRLIGSTALAATAADSRNDVLATAAVLASCLVGHFTSLMPDGWMGLAVALFILWSGVQIARDTINPLLGAAPDTQLVRQLSQTITAHPDVLGIHDLMVHDYGPGRRFASVHVEMDASTDVLHAHEVIDGIERTVKKELNIDLVIHYDPIVTDDAELSALHERIEQAIRGYDAHLSVHDFRMVRGKQHTNVIFDMVVPEDLQADTPNLRRLVNATLQQAGAQYFAVITFDCEAFNELSQ